MDKRSVSVSANAANISTGPTLAGRLGEVQSTFRTKNRWRCTFRPTNARSRHLAPNCSDWLRATDCRPNVRLTIFCSNLGLPIFPPLSLPCATPKFVSFPVGRVCNPVHAHVCHYYYLPSFLLILVENMELAVFQSILSNHGQQHSSVT